MTLEIRLSLATLVCFGALGLACASGEMVGPGSGSGASTGSGKGGSSNTGSGNSSGSGNSNGGGGSTFTGNGGSTGSTGAGGTVSTTGTGGTVSTTGTGGTTGGFMANCIPTTALISDMEDAHSYYSSNGCPGSWFLSTDPSGAVTAGTANAAVTPVAVADNPGSTMAIHVAGSGQANVGTGTTVTSYAFVSLAASLDADATHNAAAAGSLNATAYTGVKFQMKLTAGSTVYLQVSDAATDPAGHQCTTGTLQCSNHPEFVLTPSATWTPVMVPFASLMNLEVFGNQSAVGAGFPKAAIYQILWKVVIPATGPTPAWDIWIDNLSFY